MEPILIILDLNKKIKIEINILDYVVKEVLFIKYTDRR